MLETPAPNGPTSNISCNLLSELRQAQIYHSPTCPGPLSNALVDLINQFGNSAYLDCVGRKDMQTNQLALLLVTFDKNETFAKCTHPKDFLTKMINFDWFVQSSVPK